MKIDFAVRTQKAVSFETYEAAEEYARKRAHELPGILVGIYQRIGEVVFPIADSYIVRRPRFSLPRSVADKQKPKRARKRKRGRP